MTNCALIFVACAKKSLPAATSASAASPATAIAIVPGPWPSRIIPPATALPPAAASVDYPNRYLNRDPNRSLYWLSAIGYFRSRFTFHVSRFTFYASHFQFLILYENLRLQYHAAPALHHSSTPALFHPRAVVARRRPRYARLHSVQRLSAGRLGLSRHQRPRRTGGERSVPLFRRG